MLRGILLPKNTAARRAAATGPDMLLKTAIESLEDDKALDIVTIDLAGKSSIADYLVIASGGSSRHVATIGEHAAERIKALTGETCRVEGARQGDWVVIDAIDVIIHIFRPEVRGFYNLEKLWSVTMPVEMNASPPASSSV